MRSIIIYSTTDGHTKKICDFINSNSSKNNFEVLSINKISNLDIEKYELIVLGASIRYGKHSPLVFKFVKNYKKILDEKKNAFFSVNVVARKPEKSSPETNPYIKKFLKKTNWVPKKIGVFAGKVDYPNYNFINKLVIRFIMYITKGPTDISRSYEFTNWNNIKKFAQELDNL
tara:strand:- start:3019 stop:3537 length:519 start_codon:yes stop_codon:yes gene_type:complete